jgi:sterol desaturase/sphingolipid hydroxylase (fatty acid hydroxylase superfamily)
MKRPDPPEVPAARAHPLEDIGMLLAPSVVHGLLSVGFIAVGVARRGPLVAVGVVAGAVLCWTLGEYLVHRFVEHGPLGRGRLEYIDNHARHHASPWEARHFVYPLRLTLPSLAVVLGAAGLCFREAGLALAVAGGISLSYLLNEWVHFCAHRPALVEGRPWLARIVRGHLRHHHEDPGRSFGFFTTLWDHVFRTR